MTTSVIITAFNLEKYIEEAICSVLNQTIQPDEIIVVDDCSTDNTSALIKPFKHKLTYINLPQNSGGLSATFYGVRQAKGDILFFLDGDDIWLPEKIETILPVFEKHPNMGIMSHDYVRVDKNRHHLNIFDDTQENITNILKTCLQIEEQSEAFKDSILAKKGYWGGSAYSIRKSFINIEKFEMWRSKFELTRFTYLDLVLPKLSG